MDLALLVPQPTLMNSFTTFGQAHDICAPAWNKKEIGILTWIPFVCMLQVTQVVDMQMESTVAMGNMAKTVRMSKRYILYTKRKLMARKFAPNMQIA